MEGASMDRYRKFEFASLKNSHLENGFWGHRTENYMEIINSMLEALLDEKNSARLLNFEIGAGIREGNWEGAFWSDGDCYKFLEGCLYVYQNTGDPWVLELIEKYAKLIPLNQEKDGYLNTQITLTALNRWEDMEHHELYNAGHFFTFAAAHFDITGERYLIDAARKFSDYLYGVFHTYPIELANFGFNPSQIMGLYDLYRITGNKNDIKLAEIFVNMRGSSGCGTDQNQTRTKLRKETKAVGHAVTSTYLYSGSIDVYSVTGEKALLDANERIWKDLISKRIYITGGVCPTFIGFSENGDPTYEAHGTEYELPNKIAYNESCANIGTAMWAMRMLATTENTEYGDWAEQIMYNAGISGSNLSLTRYFYSNPLSFRKDKPIPYEPNNKEMLNIQYKHKSSRRWHTFDCWCCPPQLFRTMAGIGRWVYGQNEDTIYVNLFTSCNYTTDAVEFFMKTNYPWEETIQIIVKKAAQQKVKIRIPAWCKKPSVNGEAVSVGYYETSVFTGDVLTIHLPMAPVWMQSNSNIEQDRGMLAVKRGPVVYCAEGMDNEFSLDELYFDTTGIITETYDNNFLDGVVQLAVPAIYRKQQDLLYYEYEEAEQKTVIKMIPYYAWANREEADMSVWFPKA
ncbi:glycoside hydrolase family 127 protein [Faecalicatena contorta]|nr:glycoside hydrolase family 127 protein [Faecalicatena contorta]